MAGILPTMLNNGKEIKTVEKGPLGQVCTLGVTKMARKKMNSAGLRLIMDVEDPTHSLPSECQIGLYFTHVSEMNGGVPKCKSFLDTPAGEDFNVGKGVKVKNKTLCLKPICIKFGVKAAAVFGSKNLDLGLGVWPKPFKVPSDPVAFKNALDSALKSVPVTWVVNAGKDDCQPLSNLYKSKMVDDKGNIKKEYEAYENYVLLNDNDLSCFKDVDYFEECMKYAKDKGAEQEKEK